jgi:hypothetical protein
MKQHAALIADGECGSGRLALCQVGIRLENWMRIPAVACGDGRLQGFQLGVFRGCAQRAALGNDVRLKGSDFFAILYTLVFGAVQSRTIFAW